MWVNSVDFSLVFCPRLGEQTRIDWAVLCKRQKNNISGRLYSGRGVNFAIKGGVLIQFSLENESSFVNMSYASSDDSI